eukprot:TRINITY_DN35207_c0_g1_i1.p1 TRINITY_DN35207_c0_g1~~TRINITY_DN35207_c0_g1_i1.p1  ORF type:complete len:361 (+),score=116.37 TRINITY_DN35207_c0_g1_i1:80-1084(+)
MAAPMCRSRTDQFLAKRRALRGSGSRRPPPRLDDNDPLVDVELGMGGTSSYCMPEWVDALEEIRDMETALKDSLKQLAELHRKRLVPTSLFGGGEEGETAEIQMVAANVTRQFKKADSAVKRLTQLIQDARSDDEKRTITNVQVSLATQLSDLSHQFRDMQKSYLQTEKERKGKSKFQQSEELRRWEEEDALAVQEEELRMQNMSPDQAEMMKLTNEMLSQRDSELQDILKSLVDIQEMFQDLNMLVIDQGTMLDRIDTNITRAHDEVTQGVGHLKQAVDKSKHTRFKTCVCLLLVLIVFFLIALVATPSRPGAPAPAPPATPYPTAAPTPVPS